MPYHVCIPSSGYTCLCGVPFRGFRVCREGWHRLLAHTLEYSRDCAQQLHAAAPLVICSLELSVVGRGLPAPHRTALCRQALQACTSDHPHAHALADAPPVASGGAEQAGTKAPETNLSFQVQWTNMSSGPPDRSGGSSVIDHGWLNVLNLSVSCAETGSTAGDVVVAVALRNMLPPASALGAAPSEIVFACVWPSAILCRASPCILPSTRYHRLH